MTTYAAIPVKERADARPCRTCGRPTWSWAVLCVECKRRLSDEERAALPQVALAVAWPESLLLRLPPEIRERFMTRLVREDYHIPELAFLAVLWIVSAFLLFLGSLLLISVVAAAAPLGLVSVNGVIGLAVLVNLVAPLAGASIITSIVYRRVRRAVLLGQIVDQGATVRLRSCPNCGYDQAGTPGASCPECGCAVEFAKEPR